MSTSSSHSQTRLADPLYLQASRVVLEAQAPSISLLIRTFNIGYSHATNLILAMEGNVIADGELDRYTTHLQTESGSDFCLRRLPSIE